MHSRQIRIQSWVSIAVGVMLLAFAIAVSVTDPSGQVGGGWGVFMAFLAFVGVGVLGLATAREVRGLEERLARLEAPGAREVVSRTVD